jgi:hypothetical protein
MLDAELRPESGHYATVGDHLSVVGDDVWDSPSMFTALKAWLAHSTRIRSGLHHARGFRRMSNFTLRLFYQISLARRIRDGLPFQRPLTES